MYFRAAYRFVAVNLQLRKWDKVNMNAVKLFHENVNKRPDKVAFYFEDDIWTFKRVRYKIKIDNFL